MLSYATPATLKRANAEAERIMAQRANETAPNFGVPHGVATAARTLKKASETIPEFLKRIGYTRD